MGGERSSAAEAGRARGWDASQPRLSCSFDPVARYAARGTARASLRATASRASTVRSTCSATRSIRRTRSGSMAHSCFSRPNSRSTAPRLRYRPFQRGVSRGMSVCRRSALIQTLAGEHSPEGQRYLAAPRLASEPAKVHVPCSHDGGAALPALTHGVSRRGATGRIPRASHPS